MIIVTGASGFIGANIVKSLHDQGQGPIVSVDDYRGLPRQADGRVQPGAARYVGQLENVVAVDMRELATFLDQNAPKIRAILHMGACSDTTVTDRAFVMDVNFNYTQSLFKWCARHAVPFVYASSAATYGDGAEGYDDTANPRVLKPLNLYGESKQLLDLWALDQTNTPPRWAGLKFFNVYGPMESHKGRMASVVFHGFNQIRSAGVIKLFESHRPGIPHGGQKRDFIHVHDVTRTVLHFMNTRPTGLSPNGLYNVGTGIARSFEDLARATFAGLGLPANIQYIPMPMDLREKYQYFTQATTQKRMAAGVDWPFLTLEQGVQQYVQWLTENHGNKA